MNRNIPPAPEWVLVETSSQPAFRVLEEISDVTGVMIEDSEDIGVLVVMSNGVIISAHAEMI